MYVCPVRDFNPNGIKLASNRAYSQWPRLISTIDTSSTYFGADTKIDL
jgi:hypothetical protein